MSHLILVRHSLPEIVRTIAANRWHLSAQGRQRCIALAAELAQFHPDVFVTSMEPKAIETGEIAAFRLDKPIEIADGLHEHLRTSVASESRERFEQDIARFFAQPGQIVFGLETANQAHQRFTQAVNRVIERHPAETVAVITHGTVMTLFISRAVELRPFPFWQQLGMPAVAVLSLPQFKLLTVLEQVNRETDV